MTIKYIIILLILLFFNNCTKYTPYSYLPSWHLMDIGQDNCYDLEWFCENEVENGVYSEIGPGGETPFADTLSCHCSWDNTPTENEDSTPRIYLQISDTNLEVDDEFQVSIQIDDIETPVFGINLNIEFDNMIITFIDAYGPSSGSFFGESPILFTEEQDGVIDITVTRVQGESEFTVSGLLGTLTFTAKSPGYSSIDIINTESDFYNSAGIPIYIDGLVIENIVVTID